MAGHYNDETGGSEPKKCPPGSFSSTPAAVQCVECTGINSKEFSCNNILFKIFNMQMKKEAQPANPVQNFHHQRLQHMSNVCVIRDTIKMQQVTVRSVLKVQNVRVERSSVLL